MNRKETTQKIFHDKLIAVIRLRNADNMEEIVSAIIKGGITNIEITLNTPKALEWIKKFSKSFRQNDSFKHKDYCIGAGTILDAAGTHAAIDAGAQFLVSPVLFDEMIDIAHQADICAIPSGLTPTEILHAWNAGADAVKIFPMTGEGPSYLRAIHGPFPEIPLIPTSGVTSENADAFLLAGAAAIGIGTSLVDKQTADANDYSEITRRASRLVEITKASWKRFLA